MAWYWTAQEHRASYPHQGYQEERYAIECWACGSFTWFDIEEELPDATECWRCGEIINPDL
jgi:hypothetical protein